MTQSLGPLNPEAAARSIRGHVAQMRAHLNAGAGTSIPAAEAVVLHHHLTGIEVGLGVITSASTAKAQPPVKVRTTGRDPAHFEPNGLHLSPEGKRHIDSLFDAGYSARRAAEDMGISKAAATNYRKLWLAKRANRDN